MTCSGGDSAQGADVAELCGLSLPALSPATHQRLRELLPATATIANPLDYTAMIWGDRAALSALVQTVGEDPAIDRVLVFYDQPPELDGAVEESWRAVRDGIVAGAALSPVPTIVSSTLPELLDDASAWRFAQAGVPAAAGLRTGVRCAAAISLAGADPERLRAIGAVARAAVRDRQTAAVGPTAAGEDESQWLGEHEAKELLRGAGIPVVAGRLVAGEDDACAALAELGGSIALKLSAATVRHKTELGAVALALGSPDAVRPAYRRIAALAEQHGGTVLAEQMAAPGQELLVAASAGGVVPALILGLGGVWTELLADVAVVPLPASVSRVQEALRSLRAAALLDGARGHPPVDLVAVAQLAVAIGELLLAESLQLIECNPVIATARGAIAADAVVARARARARARVEVAACTT